MWKEFEETKGVIRIRKSKDRQHNGQTKKVKCTNNDLQNIYTANEKQELVAHAKDDCRGNILDIFYYIIRLKFNIFRK
jgi:hypothetical protein